MRRTGARGRRCGIAGGMTGGAVIPVASPAIIPPICTICAFIIPIIPPICAICAICAIAGIAGIIAVGCDIIIIIIIVEGVRRGIFDWCYVLAPALALWSGLRWHYGLSTSEHR